MWNAGVFEPAPNRCAFGWRRQKCRDGRDQQFINRTAPRIVWNDLVHTSSAAKSIRGSERSPTDTKFEQCACGKVALSGREGTIPPEGSFSISRGIELTDPGTQVCFEINSTDDPSVSDPDGAQVARCDGGRDCAKGQCGHPCRLLAGQEHGRICPVY